MERHGGITTVAADATLGDVFTTDAAASASSCAAELVRYAANKPNRFTAMETYPSFSPEYRQAIEASLKSFVENGSSVACVGYYALENGDCQMCGYHPITWHYILENVERGTNLVVGSECIRNYHVILSDWGWKPDYVAFPESFKACARWIQEKCPNAVVFDRGVVMRAKTKPGIIVEGKIRNYEDISAYGYVRILKFQGQPRLHIVQERL